MRGVPGSVSRRLWLEPTVTGVLLLPLLARFEFVVLAVFRSGCVFGRRGVSGCSHRTAGTLNEFVLAHGTTQECSQPGNVDEEPDYPVFVFVV